MVKAMQEMLKLNSLSQEKDLQEGQSHDEDPPCKKLKDKENNQEENPHLYGSFPLGRCINLQRTSFVAGVLVSNSLCQKMSWLPLS